MGEALARLSGNPGMRQRMGVIGRAGALERYSAERLISDIERLYAELLAGRPSISRR
jgi:hypothetical protein